MYPYQYEEEMEDWILDNLIEHNWRVVFEDNGGGVENQKSILHAKRQVIYMNKKNYLLRVGISLSVSDGKKVLWGVVYNYVVEEGK